MSVTMTGVDESIELDFRLACADLAAAKEAVQVKDTPAARARVARCAAKVDAILDLRNAASAARP